MLTVWFGGKALVWALASDETKIRWRVESMFEGYNTAQPRLCVGPLHKDWRHEGYELDRELLRGGLFRVSMQDRDPQTKKLNVRAELVPDSFYVEVKGDQANLEFEGLFFKQREGEWEETWRIQVAGDLEKGEGGWKIVRSRHEDLLGTQLSR